MNLNRGSSNEYNRFIKFDGVVTIRITELTISSHSNTQFQPGVG